MSEKSRFDYVREGAKTRDGVDIVYYEPNLPPGSKAEKRMVRVVAFMLLLSGLLSLLFVAAYVWWPFTDWPSTGGWRYEPGNTWSKGFTPILGLTLGLALFLLGFGVLVWG